MAQFQVVEDKIMFEGRRKLFVERSYTTPKGLETWEMLTSKTKKEKINDPDGVEIIPIIQFPESKKDTLIVLLRQFRPPINGYSWQFPGGLIDKGETVEEAAARELKEETGYTLSKILKITPVIAANPAVSDTFVHISSAIINGDDPINQNVQQHLGDSESIEVHLVPLKTLQTFVENKQEVDIIGARLFCFSLGSSFLQEI